MDTNESGVFLHVVTDQVRFYRLTPRSTGPRGRRRYTSAARARGRAE
jgi:hypothetical protein